MELQSGMFPALLGCWFTRLLHSARLGCDQRTMLGNKAEVDANTFPMS